MSLSTSASEVKPTSYSQASKFSHSRYAMAKECHALVSNHTWDVVPTQFGLSLVGSNWVYRVKYCSDGSVERYKARLIA